ncbi:MAG: hypothetical protein ACJ72W_06285, partial [Actinoallomurus sp.]
TKGAHFRSDPITGDVYALLDQAQVAELQAHLVESARQARARAAAWPSIDDAPAFDVGRILIDAARKKFDAIRMYQEVARQVRAQAGGDRPLVLQLDQAALGAEVLRSVLRWADGALSEYRDEIDGPDRAANALERLIHIYRDLPPRAADDAVTALINAVNALRPADGPRRLPLEVPALALDPAMLMRDVAHELQAHVRLDVTRPDGTTHQRWADSDGRVYAFDPLTFDDTTLSADLAQSAGLFPDTLRRDVDAWGINAFDLGRLYRTSWIHQQTFEQALAEEIGRRRTTLAGLDPRLPDLLDRAYDLAQRAGAQVRALEERRRGVNQRMADVGRRLGEIDGELFRLHAGLDGQEGPPGEDVIRAIERLEAERDERERELPTLSGLDHDIEALLSSARQSEQESWRNLRDLREAARRPADAERLDAVRQRVRSLLPANERPDAVRARQVRRQLMQALDVTDARERRTWAGRAADSVTSRLDVTEVAIASTRRGVSALPPERDLVESAYRRWPTGTTAASFDRLEAALRDAGPGSLALVITDVPSQRFVAVNRGGEIRWVELPTGTAAAPNADATTGTFLAFGPTGTVLDPPPQIGALDADAAVFRQLHASSHASIQNQPGTTRPAEPTREPPPETTEAPATAPEETTATTAEEAPATMPPVSAPAGVPGTSAATPTAPAATPEAGETEPSPDEAPRPEPRLDPSRSTRGRAGVGSAATVSGTEATDLSSTPATPTAPPAPSAGSTSHTPTADDPRPPWFVQHGALGDGFVTRVDTDVNPSVHAWISEVTAGMKPAAAAAVRRRILALLAKTDAKTWEKLLRSGTLIRRRGVRVKLTFSVEGTQYEPPGTEPAEEGLQTFFSKYGDTSYSEGSSKHKQRALSGRLEPLLFVIDGALSHLSPSVKISAENEFGKGRSIGMEVQSGNRVIANATHGYVGRIRVRATVDREARPELLLPGSARLAFPTAYSSAAETLGPPTEDGAHPTVRVTNPEVLQGLDHAVNAVSPTALAAGLRTELDALNLPRGVVDDLVQDATEKFFNEKTLKDRSQWWLTHSWVSSVFTGKRRVHSDFHGHLEVSGRPHTVRYVTTTDPEVLLRNDIADTVIIRDGGEHHNKASIAPALAGGVEVGDHLATPGVELPMLRSSSGQSHTVLSEGQAKNAIMRKDQLVRYMTEFTMTVTLRSATHGDHEFTVPIVGELGIGRTQAAYFEHLALAGPTGSGLQPPQDVPRPIAQSVTAPKLPAPQRAARVQRLVEWLKSRFEPERMPRPFAANGVRGVDDLLKLADRGPIEIAVPPELHRDGVPIGSLSLERWDALRTYPNVVWVYMYPETSAVVSRAQGSGGPAPWRYVLDTQAQVVGALFLPPGTTRHPTGYVPNPAVRPATEPAEPATPPAGKHDGLLRTAGLDMIADYLGSGGTPQVQLTDAVQRRMALAPEDDPLRMAIRALKDDLGVLVVAANGSRLSTDDRQRRRAPEARFVIDEDGNVRGPLPLWHHEVHPDEPIELAARKGLGPGMLRETPGLERLLREAQNALEHQMRSAGVHGRMSATDRQHLARVLAMKFGVPGMRGEYPGLMAGGVSHEITVGGYVFTVAADVRLGALRRPPVAENGVSLDAQHKGVSSVTAAEQTGIELGGAISGRFRARLSKLFSLDLHIVNVSGKRAWTRKIINTTGVKEYRRVRTNGDVTRFEYDTAYTLTVTTRRPAGPVEAAQVRELSGKEYWAAVTVSNVFLPETPVPPDDVVAFGKVTVLEERPDDGSDQHRSNYGEDAAVEQPSALTPLRAELGDEFDLNTKGLSGMQVRLTGTEEVSRHLGEMVATHNKVPWLSAKGDAFREILAQIVPTGSRYGVAERITRTGMPTYLEANARRMLKKGRLRIQLPPTADDWEQEVTVWLRTLGAGHQKPVTGATQEQYTEADLRFGDEHGVTDSIDFSGGAGTVFRVGAQPPAEGEHTTSQKASSQVSFGATGGQSGSRQRYTSNMGGGLDLNLGTYSGSSHSYGVNAVYELVHRRWRGQETRSAKRVIAVQRGVALLAPQTRAIDHGLPLPPDTERPATDHTARHPVDRELVMAASYRENADTADVLPAIEEMLGGVDPEVLQAVRTAFDEEAMRAEYPVARNGGIHQIVTTPATFWRSRTLKEYLKIPAELGGVVRTGIRVVTEEEWEQYDRPRPDVRVTVGGQAFTQKISGMGRSRATHWGAFLHGRWAGTGEGQRAAGGGHVDYESGQSSKVGNTTTIRDIRRATAKDGSQEFATGARWRIEIYQHISPNEIFHQVGRAVTAVPKLVDVLSRGESTRLWQRYFPPGRAPLGTRQVEVKAAALVPDHFTTAEAMAPAPPGKANVVVSRTPAPEPSALARVLARYVHALATPGSWQLSPWASLAAVPWRGIDFPAVSRGVAPYLADFAADSQDRSTIELALNERNLLANIAALLKGSYPIPLLNGTSLVVQLVPQNGRWLTRGGWTGLNFPEDSTEPERETEVRRGWSHGFDFELGHPVGKPLSEGAERPLLDGGPANDRGPESVHSVKKNSTGDYVESNIQR